MKKIVSLLILSALTTSSYATNDKKQIEKIFRANMDITYACPSKENDKQAYKIVRRNISNLSGSRDPDLVTLKAAELLIRKNIVFEIKEYDNLKSHEVEDYLANAKEQVERCKEVKFLFSNF